MKGGFLNIKKQNERDQSLETVVTLKEGEKLVTQDELLALCHHVNNMLLNDIQFRDDLEKRVRAGTNTEFMALKYKKGDNTGGGGCCGGDNGPHDKLLQAVIQADESKRRQLPGAAGPTKQQLEDLVENFEPENVKCCTPIKFHYVENDIVGEVISKYIGTINTDMAQFIVEAMIVADKAHKNILKSMMEEKRKFIKEKELQPETTPSEKSDLFQRIEDSDNPMMLQLKGMLNSGPDSYKVPTEGSVDDRYGRQMTLKEALIAKLKVKVNDELSRRQKADAQEGGLTATPGGWTICPLNFLSSEVLSKLFANKNTENHLSSAVISQYLNTPKELLSEFIIMDSDGILRPQGHSMRCRKGWIAVEQINQKQFKLMTHFLLRFGALPFEINQKCSYSLQIPTAFLIERTYLHLKKHDEDQRGFEDAFKPQPRLDCGSSPALDNGRIVTAIYCIEEPKVPGRVILTNESAREKETVHQLKKDTVIIYKCKGVTSRIEYDNVSGQGGCSTIATLFLKGLIKS